MTIEIVDGGRVREELARQLEKQFLLPFSRKRAEIILRYA